ncbi:MAG: adenylate/guanylate cyclase domain-containing protein, partial [Mesorhizobium sp.]
YETVLQAYRASADRVASARVLRKIGRLLWDVGKRDNAESHYAEAAALLDGADAPVEQAHLWQERGRQAFRSGDNALAAKWADAALDCVRTLTTEHVSEIGRDATLVTAEALNTKAVALARLGRDREAVGQVERSIELAEAAGLLGTACRGYTNLGVLY